MTALRMEHLVESILKEPDLQPTRVSVFLAIIQLWKEQERRNPFQISRSKIMKLSGVKSIVTYHKCISELTDRGFVLYRPSYHPKMGSEVRLK
ncbi:hypothetical protein [Algoriphagus aquimarinus]|uniref:Helix-turn-helix domain-containing protein n=1 Tax=Algoriphagus aquimarinus TaxID=237018 RepID=A0A5C7B0B2_9BACT|nr:hypothetical protein [Algoriphagus aquimarinus]TXE13413.1 hypothetical protein ESV85_05415 [Algoriphagus aquimarinus]